jgi:hypothetical protein
MSTTNFPNATDATNTNNDIIDLDLSVTKRKRFRFDHDDNRIVDLNTSDMNIIGRMTESYPKLEELQQRASKLMDGIKTDSDEEDNEASAVADMRTVSDRLKDIDKDMRDLIDFMFDAPVSQAAAPDGSMYDPYNGSFRFEYIIAVLITQYEKNLQTEFNKMAKQMDIHTAKYTKR